MQQQYSAGGLATDGGGIDPVSGNPVPVGSNPVEVRDDIEASVSEGEYVVPADVVRYYGVKFFEDLRQEAKSEYAQMDSEGRVGGEAPMVADVPDPEDPYELAAMINSGEEEPRGNVSWRSDWWSFWRWR
jgi:Arc/MetJ-type ribon-helix-helix transcriptional regulator